MRLSKIKLFQYTIPRSSLLYPPTLQVKTSDPAIDRLEGSYEKTDQYADFRPAYKHSGNDHYIYYKGKKNN